MTTENRHKIRYTLRMCYIVAVILSLVVSMTVLIISFEAAFGRKSHDKFWQSRQFYHDSLTGECYMILVDRFGRGVAPVPCDKVPDGILKYLDDDKHGMGVDK